MQEAVAIGVAPGEAWTATPRELAAIAQGYAKRQERAIQLAVMTAWHTEAFARTKRLPPLQRLLPSHGPRRPQTSREQMMIAEQICKAFGGTIEEA